MMDWFGDSTEKPGREPNTGNLLKYTWWVIKFVLLLEMGFWASSVAGIVNTLPRLQISLFEYVPYQVQT